jgi:hypothetical protein
VVGRTVEKCALERRKINMRTAVEGYKRDGFSDSKMDARNQTMTVFLYFRTVHFVLCLIMVGFTIFTGHEGP